MAKYVHYKASWAFDYNELAVIYSLVGARSAKRNDFLGKLNLLTLQKVEFVVQLPIIKDERTISAQIRKHGVI